MDHSPTPISHSASPRLGMSSLPLTLVLYLLPLLSLPSPLLLSSFPSVPGVYFQKQNPSRASDIYSLELELESNGQKLIVTLMDVPKY